MKPWADKSKGSCLHSIKHHIDSQLTVSLWFLSHHHSYAKSLSAKDDLLLRKLDLLLYRSYDQQPFWKDYIFLLYQYNILYLFLTISFFHITHFNLKTKCKWSFNQLNIDVNSDIFASTFLQLVKSSKNSILNWVVKLNLSMFCFFLCFWNKKHLTFWFKYLQTGIKEKSMYLSSQLFFKTFHKTLQFQEKLKKNVFSSYLQPKF